jgi:Flp pilus assembly protein TadD
LSTSRFWKGLFCLLFVQGRKDDALKEALRAVDIDPMAPIPAYALGIALICSGRYQHAVTCAENALARDPTHALIYRILGIARYELGQYDQATAALEMGARLSMRHPWLVGDLGMVEAAKGNRAEAERLQEELVARSRESFVSPVVLAVVPTALGEIDEAVRYIEEAYEQRDPLIMALAAWPPMENARKDPRVRHLLDQMGITWLS